MNTPEYEQSECKATIAWFRKLLAGPHPTAIPDVLPNHIAGCRSCQARLFLWSAMLGADSTPVIDCDRCEDELGAYLEAEQSNPAAALKRYPELWRHLWTCANCFELYSLMTITLSDPVLQIPTGRSQPAASAARHPQALQAMGIVQLKRTTLNAAIPRPARGTPTYRADNDHNGAPRFAVLRRSPMPDGQGYYEIEAQLDGSTASLIIHLEPASPGLAMLTGATPPLVCAPILAGKAVLRLASNDLFAGPGDALSLFLLRSSDS